MRDFFSFLIFAAFFSAVLAVLFVDVSKVDHKISEWKTSIVGGAQ